MWRFVDLVIFRNAAQKKKKQKLKHTTLILCLLKPYKCKHQKYQRVRNIRFGSLAIRVTILPETDELDADSFFSLDAYMGSGRSTQDSTSQAWIDGVQWRAPGGPGRLAPHTCPGGDTLAVHVVWVASLSRRGGNNVFAFSQMSLRDVMGGRGEQRCHFHYQWPIRKVNASDIGLHDTAPSHETCIENAYRINPITFRRSAKGFRSWMESLFIGLFASKQ